eukprot:1154637-Pelagomonas_calceolata.AAC.2
MDEEPPPLKPVKQRRHSVEFGAASNKVHPAPNGLGSRSAAGSSRSKNASSLGSAFLEEPGREKKERRKSAFQSAAENVGEGLPVWSTMVAPAYPALVTTGASLDINPLMTPITADAVRPAGRSKKTTRRGKVEFASVHDRVQGVRYTTACKVHGGRSMPGARCKMHGSVQGVKYATVCKVHGGRSMPGCKVQDTRRRARCMVAGARRMTGCKAS